ncbi:MAG: SDR family oxidoreductase, partial [Methanomassiliicoccales archaeon]
GIEVVIQEETGYGKRAITALMGNLKELRVLVNGGSSGIGLSIVKALAGEGAFVAASSRGGQRLRDTIQSLKREGLEVFPLIMDVENRESIAEATRLIEANWGGIDVLFNSAGVWMNAFNPNFTEKSRPFYSFTEEQIRKALEINLMGYLAVIRAFIPSFLAQGKGRIVNVGMDEQLFFTRGFFPITVSRGATFAMTMAMAADLEGSGITANLLLPGGFVNTPSMPSSLAEKHFGTLLSPDVVGEAARFLCSEEAEGVNGQVIRANGFGEWLRDWRRKKTDENSQGMRS